MMHRILPALAALALIAATMLTAGCVGTHETASPGNATDDAGTVITAREAGRTPSRSLQELIVERAPGFRVTQTPEGRLQVRLRAPTNFRGVDQPLFVVDGLPIDPEPDGTLPGVPVSEIASIRLLKDPAATSPYGMRGANGVIVVETKRGRGN